MRLSQIIKEIQNEYIKIETKVHLPKIKKNIERIAILTVQLRNAYTDKATKQMIDDYYRLIYKNGK